MRPCVDEDDIQGGDEEAGYPAFAIAADAAPADSPGTSSTLRCMGGHRSAISAPRTAVTMFFLSKSVSSDGG